MGQKISTVEKTKETKIPSFVEVLQQKADEAQLKKIADIEIILNLEFSDDDRSKDIQSCTERMISFMTTQAETGQRKMCGIIESKLIVSIWEKTKESQKNDQKIYTFVSNRIDSHIRTISQEFSKRTGLIEGTNKYFNPELPPGFFISRNLGTTDILFTIQI